MKFKGCSLVKKVIAWRGDAEILPPKTDQVTGEYDRPPKKRNEDAV